MRLSQYTILAIAAAAAILVGCDNVEIVNGSDNQVKAPAGKWLPDTPIADAHEPDAGGRQMTRLVLKKASYHSIWPGDDVDFSYIDTRGDTGTYLVSIEAEAGLDIKMWTRPGKTQGPSKLVYEKTTPKPSAYFATVTTTPANPVIAIRCDGTGYLYIRYLILVRKKKSSPGRININVGSTGSQSNRTTIKMK